MGAVKEVMDKEGVDAARVERGDAEKRPGKPGKGAAVGREAGINADYAIVILKYEIAVKSYLVIVLWVRAVSAELLEMWVHGSPR
jgi:hypothetical protein